MTTTKPAAMPGPELTLSGDSRLTCPACSEPTLTLTETAEDKDGATTWVNHTLTCQSCDTTHHLAIVSAFGSVVVRWLDN